MKWPHLFPDLGGYFGKLFAFQDGEGIFKVLAAVLGVLIGYLFDQEAETSAVLGVGILVVCDTITGIMVAFKKKKARSSYAFGRILTKSFGYLAVSAVGAVCEKTVFKSNGVPIVVPILYLILATEGISILENVQKLGLGKFGALRRILGEVVEADQDDKKTDKE